MDWTPIVSSAVSAVAGMGLVATFLGKYLPITKKYIGIAADSIALANIAIRAIEDKKITDDELESIKQAALKLEADFKS